jgi:hypothetical protein
MHQLGAVTLDFGRKPFVLGSDEDGGAASGRDFGEGQAIYPRAHAEEDEAGLGKAFEGGAEVGDFKYGHTENGMSGGAQALWRENVHSPSSFDDDAVEAEGAGGADERPEIASVGEIDRDENPLCRGEKVLVGLVSPGTRGYGAGTAEVVFSAAGEDVLAG